MCNGFGGGPGQVAGEDAPDDVPEEEAGALGLGTRTPGWWEGPRKGPGGRSISSFCCSRRSWNGPVLHTWGATRWVVEKFE